MRKLKEKVREKRWTIIGVAIGLALIIIGAILKQDSSELLGEILASIGIVIGLYILFRDQQGNMLKNQGGMLENQGGMLVTLCQLWKISFSFWFPRRLKPYLYCQLKARLDKVSLENQKRSMLENRRSMLKNQEKMISILEEIRDTLRKGNYSAYR